MKPTYVSRIIARVRLVFLLLLEGGDCFEYSRLGEGGGVAIIRGMTINGFDLR